MKSLLRGLSIAVAAALAGYIVWDRTEVYRLNRDIREIAARGEPVDPSSVERTPSTAPEQEAAQLYAAAAQRARDMLERDSRFTRVDVDAVVGRVDVADIDESFRKDAPALQLLDRATPLPFGGFGDAIDGPEWMLDSGLQTLSDLACLRADLWAWHGDGDAAAASLTGAVRVQRTLTSVFAQGIRATRQFGSLRILLRHAAPSPAALEALQRAFAELPDDGAIERDLMLRRATLIAQFTDASRYPNEPGLVLVLAHPFLVHNLRLQIEEFPAVLAATRTPWPDKIGVLSALAEAPANRDGRVTMKRMIFGPPMNVAAMTTAPIQAGLRLAVRRLAVTTLAIERYRRAHGGAPPADLASLVPVYLPAVPIDPFSGQPPIYKVSSADYLLYSLDNNRRDDGGQIYGTGSANPTPLPRVRDFGIRVPLTPRRGAQ